MSVGEKEDISEVTVLLQALFGEGVGVRHAPADYEGKVLDLQAFHSFTLQRAQVQCQTHTIEEEVLGESSPGGVEFRAFIKPGHGFKQYGGVWLPSSLHNFANEGIVIFICGFNDARYAEQEVCEQIDLHIEWYKWLKAKLVFIEMDDGHGNQLPWMTEHFRMHSQKDNDILLEHLAFPDDGWASEKYFSDTYHLTRQGLTQWLQKIVKPFAHTLSQKLNRKRIVFVTDSSFQAHEYQSVISMGDGTLQVSVRTLWGEVIKLRVHPESCFKLLKEHIQEACSWADLRSDVRLFFHGRELEDKRTVASYGIMNGSTILLRVRDDGPDVENYYLDCGTFFDKRGDRTFGEIRVTQKRGGESYVLPHHGERKRGLNVMSKFDEGSNAWLRENGSDGEWALSFHGTGLYNGATMAEDGFILSTGMNGIYSSPQLEVALNYAPIVEQYGRFYKVVVQNRVNPDKISKIAWSDADSELWVVPNEEDIRPYGLLLRSTGGCSTSGCYRAPWNGKLGESCCRTCARSTGRSHGPDCERKAAETIGYTLG